MLTTLYMGLSMFKYKRKKVNSYSIKGESNETGKKLPELEVSHSMSRKSQQFFSWSFLLKPSVAGRIPLAIKGDEWVGNPLAFHGEAGKPPRAFKPCGVLPVLHIP